MSCSSLSITYNTPSANVSRCYIQNLLCLCFLYSDGVYGSLLPGLLQLLTRLPAYNVTFQKCRPNPSSTDNSLFKETVSLHFIYSMLTFLPASGLSPLMLPLLSGPLSWPGSSSHTNTLWFLRYMGILSSPSPLKDFPWVPTFPPFGVFIQSITALPVFT